jgi:hypothetical protein
MCLEIPLIVEGGEMFKHEFPERICAHPGLPQE